MSQPCDHTKYVLVCLECWAKEAARVRETALALLALIGHAPKGTTPDVRGTYNQRVEALFAALSSPATGDGDGRRRIVPVWPCNKGHEHKTLDAARNCSLDGAPATSDKDEHPAWMKCKHGVLLPMRCHACEDAPATGRE